MGRVGLIKFVKEEFFENTIKNGTLCFSRIDYFKNVETGADNHKFDTYEGCDEILQSRHVKKIMIDGREFSVYKPAPSIRITYGGYLDFSHVCCFTEIRDNAVCVDGVDRVFDPSLFEFGEHLFVIFDVDNFRKKLIQKFENDKDILKWKFEKVDYIDEKNYSGAMGPFRKRSSYTYQQEYRIAILINQPDHYFIHLGNLNSIIAGSMKTINCKNKVIDGIAYL